MKFDSNIVYKITAILSRYVNYNRHGDFWVMFLYFKDTFSPQIDSVYQKANGS